MRFIYIFLVLFLFILTIKHIDLIFALIPPAYGGEWKNIESDKYYITSLSLNDFITVNVEIHGVNYKFILDTGSTNSVISKNIAEKVGIKSKKYDILPHVYGGNIFNLIYLPKIVLKEDIKIGPFLGKNIQWYILDTEQSKLLENYDGIIGRNILFNFIVHLNYKNKNIEIYLNNENKMQKYYYPNCIYLSKQSKIEIICNDKKEKNVFIDTGASVFLEKYEVGIPFLIKNKNYLDVESYSVKKKVKMRLFQYNAIVELGDYTITCKILKHISLNNIFSYKSIVLGYDFLSYFNWVFDFKNSKLYFESNIPVETSL
jgi:predicted aspartyl protease